MAYRPWPCCAEPKYDIGVGRGSRGGPELWLLKVRKDVMIIADIDDHQTYIRLTVWSSTKEYFSVLSHTSSSLSAFVISRIFMNNQANTVEVDGDRLHLLRNDNRLVSNCLKPGWSYELAMISVKQLPLNLVNHSRLCRRWSSVNKRHMSLIILSEMFNVMS